MLLWLGSYLGLLARQWLDLNLECSSDTPNQTVRDAVLSGDRSTDAALTQAAVGIHRVFQDSRPKQCYSSL